MHTVLDLDLDFFVWPIAHWRAGAGRLPAGKCEYLATDLEVRSFLEQRCCLNKDTKLPGQQFVEHEEAFRVWRRWIKDGTLSCPFTVCHVDAHADLGQGDSGWVYLLTELLAQPLQNRTEPRFAQNCLNSGNYLAFAIANRWIHSLTYVFPTRPPSASELAEKKCPDDLPAMHFRDGDWKAGLIELKQYSRNKVRAVTTGPTPTPLHVEPPVPFTCTAASEFQFSGFTHMVIARSPGYTPRAADKLLKIIREYLRPT